MTDIERHFTWESALLNNEHFVNSPDKAIILSDRHLAAGSDKNWLTDPDSSQNKLITGGPYEDFKTKIKNLNLLLHKIIVIIYFLKSFILKIVKW